MAVSLATSVNMDNVLSDIGDKISEKIGTTVRIEIVVNKKNRVIEYYLKEIKVCYDLNFRRINCPGRKILFQEVRELNIRHLDHVPAI
ncbi:GSCOCG00008634001-RA-CDS [Cotesia congregata]|nr:GSCOCG00008634001-RA-CDS [Cotesia congregata]